MKLLVLSAGGTINQSAIQSRMQITLKKQDLLSAIPKTDQATFIEISTSVGVNLSFSTIFQIRSIILNNLSRYDGFVLLMGTDSLEEMAYSLDLLLDIKKPFVITAAMRPQDSLGYDGIRNFRDAVATIHHENASHQGVLVVISEEIHCPRYLRKIDSQSIKAFQSFPGAIGQIRNGQPIFYFTSLPPMKKFSMLNLSQLKQNVPIVPIYLGCQLEPANFSDCDGIVLAGMGTGSLPDHITQTFANTLTDKIPVCITTRCMSGNNYDDFYYRGSLKKYTSKNFILEGYEGLTPYQARIKLIFNISIPKLSRIPEPMQNC